MELSDLRVFSAVARHGAITRAARELNTVQSNVTNRIKSLEAELGVPLFKRHSKGVALTSAGYELCPYADRISRLVAEARYTVSGGRCASAPLRIGSMETTAAVRLPKMLAGFHSDFPNVPLELTTGPTAELIEAVIGYTLDGAFVAGPIYHEDLVSILVLEEELVVVTASDWKSFEAVRSELRNPTVIVFRAGCSYRQRTEEFLVAEKWTGVRRIELGTLEGILGCVAANTGITLLPRAAAARAEAEGLVRLHILPPDYRKAETHFIRRKDAHLGVVLEHFLDHALNVTREG